METSLLIILHNTHHLLSEQIYRLSG